MVDSPHHPEQEVIFTLGEAGVLDPDSDTKKKSAKSAKPSKVESIEPEVKVEPEAKIDDIPEDSE